MATYLQPFRVFTRQSQCRIATQYRAPRSNGRHRWLSASQSWRREPGKSKKDVDFDRIEAELKDLRERIKSIAGTPRADEGFGESTQGSRSSNALRDMPPFRMPPMPKQKPGLLNMGEKPTMNPQEDPEFEDDDITALAHGDLEQHREYRHYARLTAWEMPLLTSISPYN
jgi:small subunit ribosomal protein S35